LRTKAACRGGVLGDGAAIPPYQLRVPGRETPALNALVDYQKTL